MLTYLLYIWPKNCGAAQLLLKEEVFLMQKRITFVYEEKVKKYERYERETTTNYQYSRSWSIMDSKSDLCPQCGKHAYIKYYY